MSGLFAGGRVLDLILAGMVLEGIFLAVLHARTGRLVGPRKFLPNLASGACLLLAMRLSLGGAWWGFAGAALLAALAAHVLDLLRRGS